MSSRSQRPSYGAMAGFVGLGLIACKLLYASTGNAAISLITGIVVGTVAGILACRGEQSAPAE